jgi:hypothetical protein
VLLLEGLPGSGKTDILSTFAAQTLPHTAVVHFAAAGTFSYKRPYSAWSLILQQVRLCMRAGTAHTLALIASN